jgi:hypothetical protein
MPIDPNIVMNLKPVQLANPLEQYMQVQQIQQTQNQSRLADLMYGEKEREVAQTTRLNDLYKEAVGADGSLDRTKLYSGVAGAGLGSRLPGIQKSFADADKVAADVAETKAKTKKADTETTGMADDQREKKRQRAITDIAAFKTPQEAMASLDAHEKAGDLTPDAAASVRATIPTNPADFPKWQVGMLQRILSAGEGMKYLAPDANTVANNRQSGANAKLQADTSRANNRDTIAATKENQKAQYDAARGVLVDTRTGTATAVTGPDGKPLTRDKAMTEFQGKSAGFADRAQEADTILTQLHAKGPTGFGLVASDRPGALKGAVESVPFIGEGLGGLVNTLPSALGGPNANQQRAEQAQRNFINAILRQESGAAIGASEFENARKQYFPQPGDTPEVIAQKAANRRTAISGLARSAGGNYTPPGAAAPSNNGLPQGWSVEAH